MFETALGRIGVAICYDSEFPLLVRAQAEAGAQILLVPSCTEFRSGYARVRTAAMARALENTCVTVLSPTVGDAPWSPAVDRNAGAAGVYVPADHGFSETGVLAEGTLNQPQWAYAEVDLARLQRVKETRRDAPQQHGLGRTARRCAACRQGGGRRAGVTSVIRNFAHAKYPGLSGKPRRLRPGNRAEHSAGMTGARQLAALAPRRSLMKANTDVVSSRPTAAPNTHTGAP